MRYGRFAGSEVAPGALAHGPAPAPDPVLAELIRSALLGNTLAQHLCSRSGKGTYRMSKSARLTRLLRIPPHSNDSNSDTPVPFVRVHRRPLSRPVGPKDR